MFRSEVNLRLSKIAVILLFISLLIMMLQPAQAAGGTISDGPSCSAIGGGWDGGSSTCTWASFLQINAGEELTIDAGVTFNTVNFINNFGTIENNGTININDDRIENNGIFNNNGTFSVNVEGAFWNNHGTFNNTGTININSSIYFLNNSQGPPEAIFYNNGTINIYTPLTNENTFYNDCYGVINGTITGNAAIDVCVTTDVCIYSYTTDEICSLDLDDEPGHWQYTDCSGGTAMGIAESVSSTTKGLKVEDKEEDWLFKMNGDYNKGVGKCAHKVDGVEVFKLEGFLEYVPNTACECL